jgi:hypothetical protein
MVTVILDGQRNLTSTQSSENGTNQINESYSKEVLSNKDTYSTHKEKKSYKNVVVKNLNDYNLILLHQNVQSLNNNLLDIAMMLTVDNLNVNIFMFY